MTISWASYRYQVREEITNSEEKLNTPALGTLTIMWYWIWNLFKGICTRHMMCIGTVPMFGVCLQSNHKQWKTPKTLIVKLQQVIQTFVFWNSKLKYYFLIENWFSHIGS